MKRPCEFRISFAAGFFLLIASPCANAAQTESQKHAARPYYLMFANSINQMLDVCESIFKSVDRPDLSESLEERLKGYQNFSGIDRSKPLGIMSTWGETESPEIIFLPIEEIDQLLKTATFGIVGYHKISADHFEIERPGTPYHVLIRNEYAYFADSPETIKGLRVTTEQLTKEFSSRYEFVVHLDLKQVPRTAKVNFVERLRAQVEPWLQERDKEIAESANLRRMIGKLSIDLLQRIILDTDTVTFGAHLDQKTRVLSFEVMIDTAKGSPLETGISRLVSRRSDFVSLISPDVPGGLAINLPLGGIVEQILGTEKEKPSKGSRLEAGVQIAGNNGGHLSLIAALRGDEARQLNQAIPHWIIRLEKSGNFNSVNENFESHSGIVFHSLVPRDLPNILTNLVGTDVEFIVGQGTQSVWLGIGNPELLPKQIKDAIDLVDESSKSSVSGPLVRARFQARQLPELITSDALSSGIDAETSRQAFEKGDDGFSLSIEPIANGLKLRIEAEEGFVRLIGRQWANQLDNLRQ